MSTSRARSSGDALEPKERVGATYTLTERASHAFSVSSSPASCTSDHEVVRPPGFTHRAFTVSKPKVKKKKNSVTGVAATPETSELTSKEWLHAAKPPTHKRGCTSLALAVYSTT